MTTRNTRTRIVLALALVAVIACNVVAPPHGWPQDRGPVVPHDTFPADCSLCHLPGGWHAIRPDFEYDHAAETGVALGGAHREARCLRCHNDRGPVAAFAQRGCGGCHVDPHRAELGARCEDCHGEQTWRPREQIERHARTRLPLSGAHAAVACFACHPGAQASNFAGLDPRCDTCHQRDLGRARDPDHQALGWTRDCQQCHVPTGFRPARFAHPPSFPLRGGHQGLDCARCHGPGNAFSGLSRDCDACHLDDYQRTADPSHAAAGFPTRCDSCHTTSGWRGARFDHRFPIQSGRHAGLSCSDCHGAGAGFAQFRCVDCHAHERGETDRRHRDVPGYVYASPACYQCHPTGR
jgi:hypothetical protein